METKKSKYDTNPLDPDVERKSEEMWGEGGGGAPTSEWVQEPTGKVSEPTEDPSRKNVYSEAPTRRYDNPPLEAPYPSVFVPPTYAPPKQQYQPNQNIYQAPVSNAPTHRPVAGLGIPEKWAVVLAYAPFFIGLVVSILELFLVPRKETKVRFHASQAVDRFCFEVGGPANQSATFIGRRFDCMRNYCIEVVPAKDHVAIGL